MRSAPKPRPCSRPDPACPPQFCPRCGRTREEASDLCDHCGEALAAQGYCGVCEAYWPLRAGTPCPKHEVVLETPLLDSQADASPARHEAWITVASFADALRAEVPRIRLEAEGIPTLLEGERMGGPSMYQVATGGVKLQVPESLVADARILLAQSWAPVAHEDTEDAWDDLAPEASAFWLWRHLGRVVVVLVLLCPLLLTLLSLLLRHR